jgi:phosphate/sulfate permease
MKFIGKSKSILATILSVAILITSSSVAFAQGSSTIANTVTPQSDILPKTMTLGNFKIDTLVNTKEKQKIKFTDLKTGKEEYLETSLENGKYVYLSTSEVGVNKVESGADVITITDQKTKEVKVISKKDVTASEITTQSWPRYGTPI